MGAFCSSQSNRQQGNQDDKIQKKYKLPKSKLNLIKHNLYQQDYQPSNKLSNTKAYNYVTEIKTNQVKLSQHVPQATEETLYLAFKAFGLNHANIAKMEHIYQEKDGLQLIYQVPAQGLMNDLVQKLRNKQEKQLKYIMKQLFQAVDYLHQNDITHGDINLQNVLCSSIDQLELFGYAFPNHQIPMATIHPCQQSVQQFFDFLQTHFKAPELLGVKDPKPTIFADIWACGIFMIYLMTGKSPYTETTEKGLQEEIKKRAVQQFRFEKNATNGIEDFSRTSRQLLDQILVARPNDRPTAKDILESAWFDGVRKKQQYINQHQLMNLYPKDPDQLIDQRSVAYMISQVYHENQREKLKKLFVQLDTDNSGEISYEELTKGFPPKMKSSDITKYCQLIFMLNGKSNQKKPQDLTINEFVNVLISPNAELTEKQIKKTFELIDRDQNGAISFKEMEDCLKNFTLSNSQIKEIFQEADKNKDGMISLKEFEQFMETATSFLIQIQTQTQKRVDTQPLENREKNTRDYISRSKKSLRSNHNIGSRDNIESNINLLGSVDQRDNVRSQRSINNKNLEVPSMQGSSRQSPNQRKSGSQGRMSVINSKQQSINK